MVLLNSPTVYKFVLDEFIKKNLKGNFNFMQLHGSETKVRVKEIKDMDSNESQKILEYLYRHASLITDGTSDSTVVNHTDPHQAPEAPIDIAAAICLPVTIPPAARIGVSP